MPLTLEEIFDTKRFEEKCLKQPQWLKSGKLSFVDNWPGTEKATVWTYDPVTDHKAPVFDPESLQLVCQEEPDDSKGAHSTKGAQSPDMRPFAVRGVIWSPDE